MFQRSCSGVKFLRRGRRRRLGGNTPSGKETLDGDSGGSSHHLPSRSRPERLIESWTTAEDLEVRGAQSEGRGPRRVVSTPSARLLASSTCCSLRDLRCEKDNRTTR